MSGYTVFLGPITGIMITDVSLHVPFLHPCLSQKVSSLIAASISIGSYTAHTSMFPQCIDLMGGIGTRMERQAFPRSIVISVLHSVPRTGALLLH